MPRSSTKPSIPLQDATKLAHDLRVELLPYFERVWIGGSVRRRHPDGGVEYFVEGSEDSPRAVQAGYLCIDKQRAFELLGWPFINPDGRTEIRARELRRSLH